MILPIFIEVVMTSTKVYMKYHPCKLTCALLQLTGKSSACVVLVHMHHVRVCSFEHSVVQQGK